MTVPTGPIGQPADPSQQEPPANPEPTSWDLFRETLGDSPIYSTGDVQSAFQKWQESQQPQEDKYEPYKDVIGDLTPEQLGVMTTFAKAYNANPEEFFHSLGQRLGYDFDDANAGPNPSVPPVPNNGQQQISDPNNPEWLPPGVNLEDLDPVQKHLLQENYAMRSYMTQMAEYTTQRHEFDMQNQQERELSQYLDRVKNTNPDVYDEDFVMRWVAGGGDGMEAMAHLAQVAQLKAAAATPQVTQPPVQEPPAPQVLSAGDLPSNQIPVTQLTADQTQDLVAKMAAQMSGSDQVIG